MTESGRAGAVLPEEPSYFRNRRGSRLFGVLHRAEGRPRLGVVFCHPFGEEKQFSYRQYAKLARGLARAGVPVIRYDSFGFGDSEGDLPAASITTMVEDALDAAGRLSREVGVDRLVFLGARLGGSIAGLAAGREPKACGVVLVSPIVSGVGYWNSLVTSRRMAALAARQKPPAREELEAELEASGFLEVQAQLVGRELACQLQALDLSEAVDTFSGRALISAVAGVEADQASARELVEHWSPPCDCELFEELERDFWSQRSMYDQYVPTTLFERVTEWLTGCR